MGDNLRARRRVAGLSQEQLANEAGLSVSVVRKIEQGGTARVETLHAIARALGIPTSALFISGTPAPVIGDEGNRQGLVALRQALMPPMGIDETLTDPGEAVPVADLWRRLEDGRALYSADRYDSVAKMLPGLLRGAEAAVAAVEDEQEQREAETLRTYALLFCGKYLTQVRQYDMAYHSLSEAIRTARATDDAARAAIGVVGMCWLLLRQDRFDEAEHLAAVTADKVEPRMSAATKGQLAVWGELLLRIAAAASRNNRPDEAAEARRMAATAASALGREYENLRKHWVRFGPVTAEMKAVEDLALVGDSQGVLRRADEGILAGRAMQKVGRPSTVNWNRHRLDVAQAHARLGSTQDAMDELGRIRRTAGNWIQHQPMARYIMTDILSTRKRTLTQEMRSMAAHLDVHA
ncbi:helix-turn-helix domain-containing protein [Streptomyces smaragdinus]|nr:helix-turn-helix transcriptional regulator [Streptomyces smaragdinus]